MCKIAHRRPCSEHLVPIGFSQCKQQSFICSVSTFMVDLPLLSEPTQRLKQPIVYGNIDEMMRLRRNVPAANRLNIIICSHLRTPKNAPKPPKEPPPRHLKEAGAVREWGRSCRNKDWVFQLQGSGKAGFGWNLGRWGGTGTQQFTWSEINFISLKCELFAGRLCGRRWNWSVEWLAGRVTHHF